MKKYQMTRKNTRKRRQEKRCVCTVCARFAEHRNLDLLAVGLHGMKKSSGRLAGALFKDFWFVWVVMSANWLPYLEAFQAEYWLLTSAITFSTPASFNACSILS